MLQNRKTIGYPVQFSGKGIHTGLDFTITLRPSNKGGIVFYNATDPINPVKLKLSHKRVSSTFLCTALYKPGTNKKNSIKIQTIEHLLSAFFGLGITDISVYISATNSRAYQQIQILEIPAIDGGSKYFVQHIMNTAGIVPLDKKVKPFEIKEIQLIKNSETSWAKISPENDPDSDLIIECVVILKSKVPQTFFYKHTTDNYIKEISPARSFVYSQDISKLHGMLYGLGGTSKNTLILNDQSNPDLEFDPTQHFNIEDEPIRHKILDLIGDLYLLGAPVNGRIAVVNPNHSLNLKIVQEIYRQNKGD